MDHPIERYQNPHEFVNQVDDLLYNALIVKGKNDPQELDLVQAYCDAILKWAGEKSGQYHLPFIGEGADAEVYWLNSDKKKVLKLTMDKDDAHACQLLAKKPDRSLLKVYKVVDICHGGSDWGYAILAEKLTPLDQKTGYIFAQGLNSLKATRIENSVKTGLDSFAIQLMKEYIAEYSSSEDSMERAYAFHLSRILPAMTKWATALEKRGITWGDLHIGNIMMRKHDPVLVDLGRSRGARSTSIPKLQVSLPQTPEPKIVW